jgi:hypothetical protein
MSGHWSGPSPSGRTYSLPQRGMAPSSPSPLGPGGASGSSSGSALAAARAAEMRDAQARGKDPCEDELSSDGGYEDPQQLQQQQQQQQHMGFVRPLFFFSPRAHERTALTVNDAGGSPRSPSPCARSEATRRRCSTRRSC